MLLRKTLKKDAETLSALAAATETELAEAGLILAKSRRKAAVALRRDVTTALSSLAMEGCRFDVSLSWESISDDEVIPASSPPLTIYVDESATDVGEEGREEGSSRFRVRPGGLDQVTFLLAAGPNESLRSMSSVASGGETARLLLAMKLSPAIQRDATHGEKSKEINENARICSLPAGSAAWCCCRGGFILADTDTRFVCGIGCNSIFQNLCL